MPSTRPLAAPVAAMLLPLLLLCAFAAPASAKEFSFDVVSAVSSLLKSPYPELVVDISFSGAVKDEDAQLEKLSAAAKKYVVDSIQKGSLNLDAKHLTFTKEHATASAKTNAVDRKNGIQTALNKLNTELNKVKTGHPKQIQDKVAAEWTRIRATTERGITVTATTRDLARQFELSEGGGAETGGGTTGGTTGGATGGTTTAPTGLPQLLKGEYYITSIVLDHAAIPPLSRLPARIEAPGGIVRITVKFQKPGGKKSQPTPAYVSSFLIRDIDETVLIPYMAEWRKKFNDTWRASLETWEQELTAAEKETDENKRFAAINKVLKKFNDKYNDFVEAASDEIPSKIKSYWSGKADPQSKKDGVTAETFVEFDGTYVPAKFTGLSWIFLTNNERKQALLEYPCFAYRLSDSVTTDGHMLTVTSRARFIRRDHSHIDEPDQYVRFSIDLPCKFDLNDYTILFDQVISKIIDDKAVAFDAKIADANDRIAALGEAGNRDAEAGKIVKALQADYEKALDDTVTAISRKVQEEVENWKRRKSDNRNYQIKVGVSTAGNVFKIGFCIARLVLTGGADATAYLQIANALVDTFDTLRKRFDDIQNSAARVKKALDDLLKAMERVPDDGLDAFLKSKDTIRLMDELDTVLPEYNTKIYGTNSEINTLIATLCEMLDIQEGKREIVKSKDPKKQKTIDDIYKMTGDIIEKIIAMNEHLVDHIELAREACDAIRNAKMQTGMGKDGLVLTMLKTKLAGITAKKVLTAAAKKVAGDLVGEVIDLAGKLKDIADDIDTIYDEDDPRDE